MIRVVREFTLHHATIFHSIHPSWSKAARRAALLAGATGVTFALAAGITGVRPALAEDGLGSPIAVEDLAEIRGGDDSTSNSHNTTTTAGSTQTTSATNEGNSIGGDVVAGNFHVQSGALNDNHGMTNVVVNTAPQSNVQGIMTLNLVLQ